MFSTREPQDLPVCQAHQEIQGNKENQDFLYVYVLVTPFYSINKTVGTIHIDALTTIEVVQYNNRGVC